MILNSVLSLNKNFYRCEPCDRFFSSNRKLKDHKQRHTSNRTKYFCSVCGKGFLDRGYLAKHEKRIHLVGDISPDTFKTHECDVCNKSFASISNLNNHKKIHSGKKFEICSRTKNFHMDFLMKFCVF